MARVSAVALGTTGKWTILYGSHHYILSLQADGITGYFLYLARRVLAEQIDMNYLPLLNKLLVTSVGFLQKICASRRRVKYIIEILLDFQLTC